MKDMHASRDREQLLAPFVVAAKTPSLKAACDVLLMHGNDLAFSDPRMGLFLVDSWEREIGDVARATEFARARMDVDGAALAQVFWSPLGTKMADSVAESRVALPDASERERSADVMARTYQSVDRVVAPIMQQLGFWLADHPWLATDMATLFLAREAMSMRERILRATGMSPSTYSHMLRCLRLLPGFCTSIARVYLRGSGLFPEVHLAGQEGFTDDPARDGGSGVELFRLGRDLRATKVGVDTSLPLFIACYLNSLSRHSEPHAFACKRLGEADAPELDVHIPSLGLGMEVKVYQSPATMTENKLVAPAGELAKQLKSYATARCRKVWYVSNLTPALATFVKQKAVDAAQLQDHLAMEVIAGGVTELCQKLDALQVELRRLEEQAFAERVEAQVRRIEEDSKRSGASARRRDAAVVDQNPPASKKAIPTDSGRGSRPESPRMDNGPNRYGESATANRSERPTRSRSGRPTSRRRTGTS